jgi:hypothetical protein
MERNICVASLRRMGDAGGSGFILITPWSGDHHRRGWFLRVDMGMGARIGEGLRGVMGEGMWAGMDNRCQRRCLWRRGVMEMRSGRLRECGGRGIDENGRIREAVEVMFWLGGGHSLGGVLVHYRNKKIRTTV